MLKFKNKILLLVFLLQIFSNFNNNVFCSRANNQGLLIANSIAKYGAFAASDIYGLKGDESKELVFDNVYLALDIFDSMLKIDNLLGGSDTEVFALACDVGLLIYDIVLLGKNTNELNKLKNDINNKKNKNKENDNTPNQVLTQSNKKKIFYTLLKHSAILADVASTIDFAGDSGRYTKSSEAILSVFLKLFSRSIDNKSAKIPNKALACLSFYGLVNFSIATLMRREEQEKTFYTLLGVLPNADSTEISRNYRKLSLRLHPDKGGSTLEFQELEKAKSILLNEAKRESYNRYLDIGLDRISDFEVNPNLAESIKRVREQVLS